MSDLCVKIKDRNCATHLVFFFYARTEGTTHTSVSAPLTQTRVAHTLDRKTGRRRKMTGKRGPFAHHDWRKLKKTFSLKKIKLSRMDVESTH